MAAELIIAPETEQDIVEVYAWYERRRRGLGEEFSMSMQKVGLPSMVYFTLHAIQTNGISVFLDLVVVGSLTSRCCVAKKLANTAPHVSAAKIYRVISKQKSL